MSFDTVIAELPSLTVEQRQLLVKRALEIDDTGLSPADEKIVEERRVEYHANPHVRISLEEMESRLKSKLGG